MTPGRIEADDWEAWSELFEFSASAFRLETLQTYTEPEEAEALARFHAGRDPELDTSGWETMIRRHRAAGRSMARVRVLVEPLSDYARFQLPYFARFADAGEDIGVITSSQGTWPDDLPRHDYWFFDDRDLWVLNYSEAGSFTHADLITDPAALAAHRRWRVAALAQATPLGQYLGQDARLRAS